MALGRNARPDGPASRKPQKHADPAPAKGREKGERTMKQISIDNGRTYCTAEEALNAHDLATIAHYMDNDTREQVHRELAPCTELEFLVHYLEIAPHDLVIG